jgi:TRAP-type C4-dicarboxylate transport system permease small subunit
MRVAEAPSAGAAAAQPETNLPSIIEPAPLVLTTQRHLKWPALDVLERILMVLCGLAITGFTLTVTCDIVTRTIGRPWLWLQEATMTFFVYGIFIGTAAATRRNDHLYLAVLAESFSGARRLFFETFNRLVVLAVACCMMWYGYLNFLDGFQSLRMPSMTPLSSLYAGIPLCGALVALFAVEQLVNGWRRGFAAPAGPQASIQAGPVSGHL